MNERLIFFLIAFGVPIILISLSVTLYFNLFEEKTWQNYDCYVFSMFWPSTSCETKWDGNAECYKLINDQGINGHMIIHGLWPSYLSGEIPAPCNEANETDYFIPKFDDEPDFEKNLELNWPGLYSGNENMWTHEYNKHGYCYIKRNYLHVYDDYKIYFKKTVEIFDKYKNMMNDLYPNKNGVVEIKTEDFITKLKNSKLGLNPENYALICNKKTQLLSEIRIIFDLNFNLINKQKLTGNCGDSFRVNFTNNNKEDEEGDWNKYDMYVYALSYDGNICYTQGKKCELSFDTKYYRFSIHGLWPSYLDGKYTQDCNSGTPIKIQIDDPELKNNMTLAMYSLSNTNSYFWGHEYNKHGYCYIKRLALEDSRLDPIINYDIYFKKALDIFFLEKFNFSYIYANVFSAYKFPGFRKTNKTFVYSQLEKLYPSSSFILACRKPKNEDIYLLDDIRFTLNMNFELIDNKGQKDNCPEIFYMNVLSSQNYPNFQDDNIKENYEIYTLGLFFETGTCITEGYECYEAIESFPKNEWILHGLWPNFKSQKAVGYCNYNNDIVINNFNNKTLFDLMSKYWKGLFKSNSIFWRHEYNKHGYCYNYKNNIDLNNYEPFFELAINLYFKHNFSRLFFDMFNGDIKPGIYDMTEDRVKDQLEKNGISRDSVLIICTNKTNTEFYISELWIKFNLDFTSYNNASDTAYYQCPKEFKVQFL